jgi:hypothetical protein
MISLPGAARVTAAAFSPDGRLVLANSFDNTARLWPVLVDTQNAHRHSEINCATLLDTSPTAEVSSHTGRTTLSHSMKLWPFDDPIKSPPARLTWDERLVVI